MTITPLPTAPSIANPTNFAARADAWIAALASFVIQANELAVAMNLNATTDTSASSVLIGLGDKSFTVSAGKSFQPGMFLVVADTAAPSTNSMYGQVTSYSGTDLVMNMLAVTDGTGSPTAPIDAWTISQSAGGGAYAGLATTAVNVTGSAAVSGQLTSSSPSAGIGYATGAGGTVTQLGDKSTAVTLNAMSGRIITTNAALAADTTVSFRVDNTSVGGNDAVVIGKFNSSPGNSEAYNIWVGNIDTGYFTIYIRNITAGSLSNAMYLNFAVIKAVAA
ncbi:MAG: hypothetical protein WC236_13885 [Gallionellaceae bacterium]|jgi:hypothetical protein